MKFSISKKSIIPKGVLHRENHKIPEEYQMGGKGIPVVSCDIKGCEKVAEVEKEELTVPREEAKIIENLAYKYLDTEEPKHAIQLGLFMYNQVINNTIDHTKHFLSKTKSGNKVKSTKPAKK